ncbi:hypothetical protein GGTG_13532 [Gaeumannomyces tritici R3-111a-1]|uniref:3CxxC-type domain-containing protein n=1 Tax=Gaeumannomyces tritici (strain R3-111a-1) TaxID=644352 RepID=J3PJ50_GAET3|nr:hypothetical protein GGTG_13532 [Gaeumannomyces tritici R3-111a-1]EJT68944.1 hypothetical protein GGTG_13532 [Gaeumannomyces tritici R3-111a-1]
MGREEEEKREAPNRDAEEKVASYRMGHFAARAHVHACGMRVPTSTCCRRWTLNRSLHMYGVGSGVVARSTCSNKSCKPWSSGLVAINIKGSPNSGYYHAEVFDQCCKACKQLGALELDETVYVERVARRLKIWAGMPLEAPVLSAKTSKPHERRLCEGCKRGYC